MRHKAIIKEYFKTLFFKWWGITGYYFAFYLLGTSIQAQSLRLILLDIILIEINMIIYVLNRQVQTKIGNWLRQHGGF